MTTKKVLLIAIFRSFSAVSLVLATTKIRPHINPTTCGLEFISSQRFETRTDRLLIINPSLTTGIFPCIFKNLDPCGSWEISKPFFVPHFRRKPVFMVWNFMCQMQLLEKDLSAFRAARGNKTVTEALWSSAVCVGPWLRPSDPRDLAVVADVFSAFRIGALKSRTLGRSRKASQKSSPSPAVLAACPNWTSTSRLPVIEVNCWPWTRSYGWFKIKVED